MKKRLALRLCAIMLAAVFLVSVALSFVEPVHVLIIIGAGMALMAVLVTVRPVSGSDGHDTRAGRVGSRITADYPLMVILGTARLAWPDPDQLTYADRSNIIGRTFTTTRSWLASIWTNLGIFSCGQTDNSAYNARDQSAQITTLPVHNAATAMAHSCPGGAQLLAA